MKREEKSGLARRRILEAALEEFSRKGYEGASLSEAFGEKGLSKGIVYHHFKDKDELYLLCVARCFDALTAYLREAVAALSGTADERLQAYFDARLRFFLEHPEYLGLFTDAAFAPPAKLRPAIGELRRSFDELNAAVLTELLNSRPVRKGLSVETVVEDIRMYMDYFNLRFREAVRATGATADIFREHEERSHRQLNILLYGVFDECCEN